MNVLVLVVASVLALSACQSVEKAPAAPAVPAAQELQKEYEPISMAPFMDSINHARYQYKDQVPPYAVYNVRQVRGIAENFLALQNPDGGWGKNLDWMRVMEADQLIYLTSSEYPKGGKSTLDNRNVYTQVEYLALAYKQIPDKRYAACIEKAVAWLLASQHPSSGGFTGADVVAVTYNDDVMTGALRILYAVSTDAATYGFLSAETRAKAAESFKRGLECILKTQIRVNGKLTAWCQQHSHETLEPIWARTFEPASITAGESVGVIELLIGIENPSPEVKAAIVGACEWLASVQIPGIKLIRKPAEPATLNGRYSDYEVLVEQDSAAKPMWARFYDLETQKPLFYDRDRKLVAGFNDLSRERRVGYGYLGTWPANLLAIQYPAWKARNGL